MKRFLALFCLSAMVLFTQACGGENPPAYCTDADGYGVGADQACVQACMDQANGQSLNLFMELVTCAQEAGCGWDDFICIMGSCSAEASACMNDS